MTDRQKTASGREVKRTGMNDSKTEAMKKLRQAREGGIKRTDQYEVSFYFEFMVLQVKEQEAVFEDVSGDEYEARQAARRNDDFIVDDDGFGYQDNGGEIWEANDDDDNVGGEKKKKRKLGKGE